MTSVAWPALAAGLFTLTPASPTQAPTPTVVAPAQLPSTAAPLPGDIPGLTFEPSTVDDLLSPQNELSTTPNEVAQTPSMLSNQGYQLSTTSPTDIVIDGKQYVLMPVGGSITLPNGTTTQIYTTTYDPTSIDHMPNGWPGGDPNKLDHMAFWSGGDPNKIDHMAFGIAPKPKDTLPTLPTQPPATTLKK